MGNFWLFFTLLLNAGLSTVAVSSIGPTIIILFFGITTLIKSPKNFNIGIKKLLIIIGCGGIIISIQYYAAAKALSYVSQSIYTIVEFSHVFLLMILTSIIFKYKMNKIKIISLLLAVAGLALVLNVFASGIHIESAGIMWLAINWFTQCCLAILIKSVLNDGVDNNVVIFYYNLGAAIIYWISCPPWEVVSQILNSGNVLRLVIIIVLFGIFNQILSGYCWIKSFSLIDPATTNALIAFAPITALILGYFVFSEKISVIQLLGVFVVIGAVLLLNKTSSSDGVDQEETN